MNEVLSQLGFGAASGGTEEPASAPVASQVDFFSRRYRAAYAVARGLLVLRWVLVAANLAAALAGVTVLLEAEGLELLAAAAVPAALLGSWIAWLTLDALAAMVRVQVDIAVALAPGLSGPERLGILRQD